MRIGLHSASTNSAMLEVVVGEVRKAAEHGLSSYWAPMLGGLDTLTALAVAGREVPGIELGTAVVPMPVRSPFALAQQVGTVQQAVGGRLVLGVGTSHEELTRTVFRQEWTPPLPTARAYLTGLRELFREPAPQLLLGAVNPAMVRLASELADGLVTWAAGLVTLGDVVGQVVASRDEPFRVVAALPVCVTDDSARARQHIDARLGASDRFPSYQKLLSREGASGIAQLSIVGTATEVDEQLDAFAAVGVTDFAAHVLAPDDRDLDATWTLLAARAG